PASHAKYPNPDKTKDKISGFLTSRGFNEIITNPLSSSEKHEKAFGEAFSSEHHASIVNPISSDLDILRRSMLISSLEVLSFNINRKQENLKLFEFGKTYEKLEANKTLPYKENEELILIMTGDPYQLNWNSQTSKDLIFHLKSHICDIFEKMGLSDSDNELKPEILDSNSLFKEGLKYKKADSEIAEFGLVDEKILDTFDINREVVSGIIHWEKVFESYGKQKTSFKGIPRSPSVRRDLSLLLDKNVKFQSVKETALKTENKLLKEVGLFDIYEGDKIEQGKKSYALYFIIQDKTKTLTDKEINKVMEKIQKALENEVGAKIRGDFR
ncbi:MAG: phenylalanine--tRNA ligase subunit beta, partial [Flavobacteriales bacterium]